MKNWSLKKKNKVVTIGLGLLLLIYVIHSIFDSISLYNCIECSAPWHVALLFTTAIYIIPVIVFIILKIVIVVLIKKKDTSF